ncbi:MAG: hypothetical protein AAFW73_20055 [Bacteroidota bacterium]
MKILLSVLSLVFLFGARSCGDRVQTSESNAPLHELGDTLTLVKGEPLLLAGESLSLTYAENNDNRCPQGVNCIVAGVAKVSLGVAKAAESELVKLEVKGLCDDREGSCGNQATVAGYRLHILTADPYPGSAAAKSGTATASIRLIVSAAQ